MNFLFTLLVDSLLLLVHIHCQPLPHRTNSCTKWQPLSLFCCRPPLNKTSLPRIVEARRIISFLLVKERSCTGIQSLSRVLCSRATEFTTLEGSLFFAGPIPMLFCAIGIPRFADSNSSMMRRCTPPLRHMRVSTHTNSLAKPLLIARRRTNTLLIA